MHEQNRTACLSFNVNYFADPSAHADALLDDASLWFGYAQGITRALGDALIDGETITHSDLSSAMHGVTSLITMGMGCTQHAHRQLANHDVKKNVS